MKQNGQAEKAFLRNKDFNRKCLILLLLTLILPFAFLLYGLKKCLNREFLKFYGVDEIALIKLHTYSNTLNIFLGLSLTVFFNLFNPFLILLCSSLIIFLNELLVFVVAKQKKFSFVVFYSVLSGGLMSALHNTKNTCVTCLFMGNKKKQNASFLFSLINFTNSVFVLFFSLLYPYLSSNKGWSFYKIYSILIFLTAISPSLALVVFVMGTGKVPRKTTSWKESKRKLLKTLRCSKAHWAWIAAGVMGNYAYYAYGTRRMNLMHNFVPKNRLFIISGCSEIFRITSPLFAWLFLGTKRKQKIWFRTYFILILFFFLSSIMQLFEKFFQGFWTTLILQLIYGFSGSVFGSSFYPYFYYVFNKECIGSGFGLYMSIKSASTVLLNFLMELTYVKEKEHLYMLLFLSAVSILGLLLSFL